MKFYKGEWCIYNPNVFCQEGYCDNCYLKGDEMKFYGICKAKDLIRETTFRWYGIGEKWEFDETDSEIINSWRN